MSDPISPWSGSAERISPDGRFRACIAEAWEIAMGGPTGGTLVISDSQKRGRVYLRLDSCSPSFVWSSDSGMLAVPRWTNERMQRLNIVSIAGGNVRQAPGEFSVLELHSFEAGILRGVDSPIHQPRAIELSVGAILEEK